MGDEWHREESDEELKKFGDDPRYIHFAGMIGPPRPGVVECLMELEHTYYKPGTLKNDDLFLRIIKWDGITWALVSIPIGERHWMEKVADKCGLRIADGVPTMLTGSGAERFPIDNERVFTLENKTGHPIYHNDPAIEEIIREAEGERVEKIQ